MSILIRGMEMPKNCDECDIHVCKLWLRMTIGQRSKGKHPSCPLVEIPTPHGRLIDGDKFYKVMCSHWVLSLGEAYKRLEEFLEKPVIEAEGET